MCAATSGSTHSGRNAALRPLNSAKTPIQIAFSSAVVLACIWVCTCMCMYACTHTRTYMHACTLGLLYLHAFEYARACACTHPSTMSAIFLTLCLCMCGHNTRSLALRKHFWLKLDPTSLQDFSLSDLHHACRHEVREGYEDGQEAPAMKKDLPPSFYKIQGFILNSLRTSE